MELKPSQRLALILADQEQIQQVLINIVSNASESIGNENGTITVTTGVMGYDRGTKFRVLFPSVKATGSDSRK